MIKLRDYQVALKNNLYASWSQGSDNVMLVSPTGSGKTVVMSSIAADQTGPGVAIAHRVELVGQISQAMARMGIEHNIIGPTNTVTFCIRQQIAELGRKFHNPNAKVTVAAVDTLKARSDKLQQWCAQQTWWMIDEAHHVLTGNKWGSAVTLFPRARGVGVTATPVRADRKSLHANQGGVFHDMVLGPSMRDLIERGALCDYRIFAPPQSIDTSQVKVGSTGDYSQPGLREAAHESQIVGDVVSHYLKFASGLRGITFVVDVEQAVETAEAFTAAGVPAMAVSAKTPDAIRAEAVRKLRDGVVLQLVNVDLFGEGFDVPAVECVSMARPTMSYGLFVQQFGRALRPLSGKTHGIIIDHVGNVKKHGLPDAPRNWTLYQDERGKRVKRDEKITPVTSCLSCFMAYEATHSACPFCGHKPEPVGRKKPEQVDGDLVELDGAVLAQLRGEADRIMGDAQVPVGATPAIEGGVKKQWARRRDAQEELRRRMALWGGLRRDRGDTDSMMQRRFFFRFGVDVMSAQSLGAAEAERLADEIAVDWTDNTR